MPTGVFPRTEAHRANLGAAQRGNHKALGHQNALRHGHACRDRPTPTYTAWQNMRGRCRNPNHLKYPAYGGRGIGICDRWAGPHAFPAFLQDMGERPDGLSLDRFPDPYGNYEPGNCRWATAKEQAANRRARGPG